MPLLFAHFSGLFLLRCKRNRHFRSRKQDVGRHDASRIPLCHMDHVFRTCSTAGRTCATNWSL